MQIDINCSKKNKTILKKKQKIEKKKDRKTYIFLNNLLLHTFGIGDYKWADFISWLNYNLFYENLVFL